MTMVIDLGLERYFHDADPELRLAAVRGLVERGVTTWVRELIGRSGTPAIYAVMRKDAQRVEARFLTEVQAAPIWAELELLVGRYSNHLAFSWDQVEQYGLELPELALTLDGLGAARGRVELPGLTHPPQVDDFSGCWLGSSRVRALAGARSYLAFARKHRLILHTA